jgi:YidC/Oxa1 family membrane protein insertase
MDKRSILFVLCVTLAFFGVNTWFGDQQSENRRQHETKIAGEKNPSLMNAAPHLMAQHSGFTENAYDGQEEFYVLENEYQQLVFSTRGGSLAEINLPFLSKKHPGSIVKEIDIDRLIEKQSPQNAYFPLESYQTFEGDELAKKEEGVLGGYYPLLRRTQLNADGSIKHRLRPEYYALNIVGENPAIAKQIYRVTRFEKNLIEFTASFGSTQITKTYSLDTEKSGPYCFHLDVQVRGDASGLWLSSGVPDVELVGGSYSPLLKIQTTGNRGPDVEELSLPKKGPTIVSHIAPNWISNSNGFLGLIIDPMNKAAPGYQVRSVAGKDAVTRLSLIDAKYNLYPSENYPAYASYLPLKNDNISFRIFAGPFDDKLLKMLDNLYENPLENYNPDYASAQSIQGWFSFISQPFAKFLFFLMQMFYAVTHSWAVSIVLLTIALRVMMYPLNNWSIKSTIKMQAIAPKIKALQEKYKKDPRKAQLETVALYKQEGVNPLSGCLPLLFQMPFLIGMFYLLKSSFPLRGAMFIPGWIDDLAAPDVLFSWDVPIWFIGNEFHLLPVLMAGVMFIQQRMSAKWPDDPKQVTDTQKQQRMMGNVMSLVFAFMFYNFPSGLNIYFMLSTLLGILQQNWMTKTMQKK